MHLMLIDNGVVRALPRDLDVELVRFRLPTSGPYRRPAPFGFKVMSHCVSVYTQCPLCVLTIPPGTGLPVSHTRWLLRVLRWVFIVKGCWPEISVRNASFTLFPGLEACKTSMRVWAWGTGEGKGTGGRDGGGQETGDLQESFHIPVLYVHVCLCVYKYIRERIWKL